MDKEILGDRYQLLEPIGRGGMATVYRGQDLRMDRIVAVKVLREAYSTDPKFVIRFQREAKAASSLHQANIVQVYDYGQSDGVYYIVMELIEGTDLRRYLRSRGILAIDRAVIIAHDVASGLGAAHRRDIVNRDVKPQNILVGRDGSIKLTDFGIAMIYKDINTERLTTTGMTLGTVQYYAPEQAQGEIVTPAADVYALGIVMYEMLTGRTPFDGDTPVAVAMQHIQDSPIPPSQYNPNIPPALEDIIMRCLEKVPEMRYRNGSVLAQALAAFMEETFGDIPGNPGSGIPPVTGPGFNTIPPRPNNPRPNGQMGPIGPSGAQLPQTASSPNNMLPPASPMAPNSPIPPVPFNGHGQGMNDANTFASDQTIRMSDRPGPSSPGFMDMNGVNGVNGYNGSNGANGYNGQAPDAMFYNQSGYPGSGLTRPYQRDALAGQDAKQSQQDARFRGVITALILVVTLIFLGFCIFLASQLGLLPFWNPNKPQITPTSVAQSATVPDLRGKTLDAAKIEAKNAGNFVIHVSGTLQQGIVESQDPGPNVPAARGATISVTLKAPVTPTATVIVPTGLNGETVTIAENTLNADKIPYTLVSAGSNANYPSDIVKGTNPNGGSPIPSGTNLQVYVWNCTSCTLGTPTSVPTNPPAPTATPTTGITPTPTPTTGITPTPTPTTGITPTPTQPGITPTPKVDPTP